MSTISASTTSTTAFKVTSDTTGTLVFQTGASPTTAMTISSSQIVSFANPPTATGAGSVATNTAYGTGALASNTTGDSSTAIGYQALNSNVTNTNGTAVGYQALRLSTAENNTAIGKSAASSNTSGASIVAVGMNALFSNNTGDSNTAVGFGAGYSNTSAVNSTFMGYQAGYYSTAQRQTFLGYQAGRGTSGSATGAENTAVGRLALYNFQSAGSNSCLGHESLYTLSTGTLNTAVGYQAGYHLSTGSKNTILGNYNGNQGGLDIRTASNYIVLSDGDGNPRFGYSGTFGWVGTNPMTASGSQATLAVTGAGDGNGVSGTRNTLWLRNSNSSSNQSNFFVLGSAGTASSCIIGNDLPANGTAISTLFVQAGGSGGVNLTSGATSWTSASDARLKNVTGTYTNALADIAQIEAVKFTWKSDQNATPQVGVIAQSVQAVVPEAIDTVRVSKEDETDYLSVKYTELIPLMIAAIQELKAEIETLKGQA